jgi:RNA recognition motif-containing protein
MQSMNYYSGGMGFGLRPPFPMENFSVPVQIFNNASEYQDESLDLRYIPKTKFNKKNCIYVGDALQNNDKFELKAILSKTQLFYKMHFPITMNGNSKGFALLKFTNAAQAKSALYFLKNAQLNGRPMNVQELGVESKTDHKKRAVLVGIRNLNRMDIENFFAQFGEVSFVEIYSERNIGFVQFKEMKFNYLITTQEFGRETDRFMRISINNEIIQVKPYESFKTLYFQNLPPLPIFDGGEFKKFIENNGFKIIDYKYGYSLEYNKSWTFLNFENYDQARTAYEYFQGINFNGSRVEVIWPNKNPRHTVQHFKTIYDKKRNLKNYQKIHTRSFLPHITNIEVEQFFSLCTLPHDDLLGKKKIKNKSFFN